MDDELQRHIAAVSSGNAALVAAAAEALTYLGTDAQPAAVALVRACGTSDPTSHAWCTAALEELGTPPVSQIEALTALAGDPVPNVSYWAVTLLGRCGSAASPAVAVLARIVRRSTELPVRERAIWALGKIGPAAAAAVPALHEAAAGGPPRLSRLAENALAAITG
jgi:hypothetical protein